MYELVKELRRGRARPDPEAGLRQDWHTRLNALIWLLAAVTVVPVVVVAEHLVPRKRGGMVLMQRLTPVILGALGIRVEITGRSRLPAQTGYVLVANHRSLIDTLVLLLAVPKPRVVGTHTVFKWRWTAPFCSALGGLPVNQQNALASVRDLQEAARGGLSSPVIVFPEGHRSFTPRLLPFQIGGYVMAIEAGAPVVPVAIHNSAAVLHADGGFRSTHPGRIIIEILDPIPTEGLRLSDRGDVVERSRTAIRSALRPCDGGTATRTDLRLSA